MRETGSGVGSGRSLLALHGAALGLWLGALGMTGVIAGIAFPEMRALEPALPGFAAYAGEHWPIAAGRVMNRAFGALLLVQVAACSTAAAALGVAWACGSARGRRWAVHGVVLSALVGLLVWQAATQRAMGAELRAYWAAAEAGENERAAELRAGFDAMHRRAEAGMKATAGGLAVGVGTLVFASAAGRRRREP